MFSTHSSKWYSWIEKFYVKRPPLELERSFSMYLTVHRGNEPESLADQCIRYLLSNVERFTYKDVKFPREISEKFLSMYERSGKLERMERFFKVEISSQLVVMNILGIREVICTYLELY